MIKSKAIKSSATFGLRGVGPALALKLAKLEIYSPLDLLFHLPTRYQDRTSVQMVRSLISGQEAVVEGVVVAVTKVERARTKLLCTLRDATGVITLRFFHMPSYQLRILQPGTRLRCYGQARWGNKGMEMVHPEMKVMAEDVELPTEEALTPIYPLTEGLTQHTLRKLSENALAWMKQSDVMLDILPKELLQSLKFPTLREAIEFVHRPASDTLLDDLIESKTPAQKRMIFEELLSHRLSLLRLKLKFKSHAAKSLVKNGDLIERFHKQLPFALTNAQARVVDEIAKDIESTQPMLRLVQGDVGSGKTVVAATAMLQAVENNCQAVLMAPTELLAEQHYRNFKNWLEPLGIKVAFLSGNVKAQTRRDVLAAIEQGDAQVVLGTHALFQEAVNFSNLALVIVDEQHRFGVHQRATLRDKGSRDGSYPHQLIMTATPIPRTLAMSFYADLDCSVIDELPPGRTPVSTIVIANSRRDDVIQRINEACHQGRQVYWVCPLIEESETLNCQAASVTATQLHDCLPGLKVDLVHGRMKQQEKEAAMRAFQRGETNVLVATTVIEVGVDVPNASLMVIENAERLGLSQLHQLRGRVGRGSVASHCVLLYQHPLSNMARERLAVMRETTDGFRIAQRDLELRGPGEVLGTRQTGELSFYVADLIRDSNMLADIQKAADTIIQAHPDLVEPLIDRWLGRAGEYGKV